VTQAQFDFEQAWAGRIPARWRWTRNKELLVESQAVTVDGSEVLLSVSHLTGITPKSEKNVTMTAAENLDGYRLVDTGHLVINTMWAWMGALGVARQPGIVSPAYGVYSPRPDAPFNPAFYDYLYRSSPYVMEMTRLSRGIWSSRLRLYPDVFLRMAIPVPPPEEQRAIADYLDRETAHIDKLVDEQQRLIEMLRERRRAAVEEAVSTVATSGARLKHIIRSVRQGWSPQCYAWPADGVETWAVLKTGAANGGRFRPMENKELPEDEVPRPDMVVTQGDLIVSRANTRELVGSAAVVEGDFPRLMLCDKLYAFSLDGSRAESRFVAAVLGSRRWRDLIELEATGASHSMLNISQSDIVNLPMPMPPVEEQRRIVAHLDGETIKIDQLIAEGERFVELARERRAALVTAAVTGRLMCGRGCDGGPPRARVRD
jgi:type I restriction enzyme S subunit